MINLLKINVDMQIKECNFAVHRGMEQLVARRAHNPKVIGSSPVPATPLRGFHQETSFYKSFIMFVVYVLHSEIFDKIYIGFTSNIENRLLPHL